MAASSRPVLCGHGEGIHFPAGGGHSMLKVGHEPTGGFGAAGARPQASGKVRCQDIKQRVALGRIQTAIRRSIGIAGIQGSNQLAVFLDNGSGGNEPELVPFADDLTPGSPILAVRGGIPFDGGTHSFTASRIGR
jgi:hypothetical protein